MINTARCGLCNIPVDPKEFKAHVESLEHKITLAQMLGIWVDFNTRYKSDSKAEQQAVIDEINAIRERNGIKPMGADYE